VLCYEEAAQPSSVHERSHTTPHSMLVAKRTKAMCVIIPSLYLVRWSLTSNAFHFKATKIFPKLMSPFMHMKLSEVAWRVSCSKIKRPPPNKKQCRTGTGVVGDSSGLCFKFTTASASISGSKSGNCAGMSSGRDVRFINVLRGEQALVVAAVAVEGDEALPECFAFPPFFFMLRRMAAFFAQHSGGGPWAAP